MIERFGVEFRSLPIIAGPIIKQVGNMVLMDYRQLCLAILAMSLSFSVHAQIYTWVDENGQTHYSQQPPASGEAETIDVPLPPPIDQEQAQQEVDELIEQQQASETAAEEAQQEQQSEAERQAAIEQNCATAQSNLQLYQNNPGRRFLDEEGNAYRLSEEERQQKIEETQQQIEEFCP
jgi:hypothetical protein